MDVLNLLGKFIYIKIPWAIKKKYYYGYQI